jgi:hypothetical protein
MALITQSALQGAVERSARRSDCHYRGVDMIRVMQTYVVSGLVHDDGTPVTFQADDGKAATVPFQRLQALGQGYAVDRHYDRYRHRSWVTISRRDISVPDLEEYRDQDLLHSCALDYALYKLTDYLDWVRRIETEHEETQMEMCAPCKLLEQRHEIGEELRYGFDARCPDCEAQMDAKNARCSERLRALGLGVASWVKTRWPELEIDGDDLSDGYRSFTADELATAVRGLTHLPEISR